ncbi:MAG: SRPBCC family protein [Acidobacteria bacterium]|nr:SRPBCC family protein [Acidobacteriota bacterium]
MARGYQLQTRLLVARDLDTTFAFFADAGNLQRLTPSWLNFAILTPPPIAMRRGARIDYRIRVHGIPITWHTEITDWDPPHRFVDEQRRGPYWLWRHTHTFTPVDEGTLVEDTVHYRPIGGPLVHAAFVRRDLERIFTFRQRAILDVFGVEAAAPLRVTIEPILLPARVTPA